VKLVFAPVATGDGELTGLRTLPGFAEVIDRAPDAIVLVDFTGEIVYANQRVAHLFGTSPADLIGQPVEALIPERHRGPHVALRSTYVRDPRVRPMGNARLALAGRRADGSEFPVDIHLAPINADGHPWTIAVIRDGSEQRRFEGELRQARQAAEEVARVKGEFLSMAAHDLSQPVQSLELVIGAFERGALQASEIAELTAIASTSLQRMRELLKMLTEISRLESGTMRVSLEPVRIADICDDLERQFGPVARAKALHFAREPCGHVIETDPALLRGMLSNLVANAIRYTPNGEVWIRCIESADGSLQLTVCDTGIGIPGDQLQIIFNDFQRLEAARHAYREGFGLGLGIVRRLSRLLGLSVSVQSSVGCGSTFGVEIPPAKVYRLA
jgi:PAS domain S-box-containing protein